MNFERQYGCSWISLSSEAGVRHAPAPAIVTSPNPQNEGAGSQWLNTQGSNGATNGNKRRRHLQGGRWVQIAYTLFDICCIVVNGGIAYLLRFSSDELRRSFSLGHFGLVVDQIPLPYGGFLFLYVALILLSAMAESLQNVADAFSGRGIIGSSEGRFACHVVTDGLHLFNRRKNCFPPDRVEQPDLNVTTMVIWRYVKDRS